MADSPKTDNNHIADCDHVSAAIVVIGDEILSGRTRDTNTGTIAAALNEMGIALGEVRIVPDEVERIVAAVNAVRRRYDYVFTTGGIGPTHDDITADAIAAAFNVPLLVDERALAMLRERYAADEITPSRLRMARIPQGADLIANTLSKAPGFRLHNVHVLAGVPAIMQVMLDAVLPTLKGGRRMLSQAIDAGVAEGVVGVALGEIQARHGDVKIGSYPYIKETRFMTNIVVRSTDRNALDAALKDVRAMLSKIENGRL